jgi:hypothetical protein
VPRGSLSNYCERCGRRVEVRGAKPGEHDLGLDRINAAFRYCSTCQLFVGRDCCWNVDVLACSGCAALGSEQAASFPVAIKTRREFAIRRLADLTESVDDLQKVAKVLDARTAGGVALADTSWGEAWDAASWLIARSDTSRDAVARALWPPPDDPARDTFEQFRDELADLMKAYLAARASVEQRLTATGHALRGPAPVKEAGASRLWRRLPRVPALLGAVAAVFVIVGGLALFGGRVPEMDILGGQAPGPTGATAGGPQASAAAPSPDGGSAPAAPAFHANLDFNMLRVGALDGASEAITSPVGLNEVVPFPSPFDRSIRMSGSGSHRFCVSLPDLRAGGVSVSLDLYAESLPFGVVEIEAVPSDGPATTTRIPEELTASLVPGRWYQLAAQWQPDGAGTIVISDGLAAELIGDLAPASLATSAGTDEGLCLSASGIASDGELMLDNLRVEQ